jgi:hypothetical protein
MPTLPDATRASYPALLAAYQAEQPGSTEALTYAQHVVERLIADDVFGRLAVLRDELRARLDDEVRDRQMAAEYALGELDEIVGAEP